MTDLLDGETHEMWGSGAKPYILKNIGGVYSCTCPAWRFQNDPPERRTCKHLKKLRGDAAEQERIGAALQAATTAGSTSSSSTKADKEKPALLLAEKWDNATDVSGWWMSEKLDGVRAFWDGKQFLSRQGNVYHAPDWFVEGLPDVPLDGEIWLDRGKFNRAVSIARRQDKGEQWKELSFVVFDAPQMEDPFEQRLKFIADFVKKHQPEYVRSHPHDEVKDLDHLRAELARIEELGGEGLMLRQPASLYVPRRSTTLLKVKTFIDAEATVVGHVAGKGRHKGRMGALEVQLADGTQFKVGTGFSDAQRDNPPAVGTVITFRYQELTPDGVPRFPSFVRFAVEDKTVMSKSKKKKS